MDIEIALSRSTWECDHAALALGKALGAQQRELLRFWDCLTPCDALAGPDGRCAITALVWDVGSGTGSAVLEFAWRANHGCRDIVVTGSDRLKVALALDAPRGQLRISATDRPPTPTTRDEL